ncbi:MAG: hypothetical protein IJA87_06765 [Clostridia bacterium]|nr:hypothetical protein [Clostridia bacterium]
MNNNFLDSLNNITKIKKNKITVHGYCYLFTLIDAYEKKVGMLNEQQYLLLSSFKESIADEIKIALCENEVEQAYNLTWMILSPENQKKIFDFNNYGRYLSITAKYFFNDIFWQKILKEEHFANQEFLDSFFPWFEKSWGASMPTCIAKKRKGNIEKVFCPYYITVFVLYLCLFDGNCDFDIINSLFTHIPSVKFIICYIGFTLLNKNPKKIKYGKAEIKPYGNKKFLHFANMIDNVDWNNSDLCNKSYTYKKELKEDIDKIIDSYIIDDKKKNFIELSDVFLTGVKIKNILTPRETNKSQLVAKLSEEVFSL